MDTNYSLLADECFKKNDYQGYLKYATMQYNLTSLEEDKQAMEKAKNTLDLYKDIQKIIEIDENDYYKILNVSEKSTIPEINKAFRTLAFKYHPDRAKVEGSATAMRMIQKAYFEINTEEKKAAYDSSKKIPKFFRNAGPFQAEDIFSHFQQQNFGNHQQFSFGTSPNGFHFNGFYSSPLDDLYRNLYRNAAYHPSRRYRRAQIPPTQLNTTIMLIMILVILLAVIS
jgi:DnaJ domain